MSINPHFKTFLGLSEAERRIAYESAADIAHDWLLRATSVSILPLAAPHQF